MVIGWGLSPVDRLFFNILEGRGPSPVPVISPPLWRRGLPPFGGPAPPPSLTTVSVPIPVAVNVPVLVAVVFTCIAVVPVGPAAGATRAFAVAVA